jgi:predicted peptidase
MRPSSLAVVFALISVAACASDPSPGPVDPLVGSGGTGGLTGTNGQVDSAGVGDGATTATTGFVDKSLSMGGGTYKYKVFVPENYNTAASVPVLLALHGLGDRGSDNLAQTRSGVGVVVRAAPTSFPAIVVFPQGPTGETIQSRDVFVDISQLALNLTLAAYKKYDPARVYVTGYSWGGIAAFQIAYFNSSKFAAFLPVAANICNACITGSGTTTTAQASALVASRLKTMPVWQFQGEVDTNVPTSEVRQIRDAFVAVNANYTYTELKGLDHGIADGVYARPDVWAWLWAQHR